MRGASARATGSAAASRPPAARSSTGARIARTPRDARRPRSRACARARPAAWHVVAAAGDQRRYAHARAGPRASRVARSIACCCLNWPRGADAARHARHQLGQARPVWSGCIQRSGSSGIKASMPPSCTLAMSASRPCRSVSVSGDGARIEQHQALEALELPADNIERKIAAERQADQRETRRRVREQLVGHARRASRARETRTRGIHALTGAPRPGARTGARRSGARRRRPAPVWLACALLLRRS